MFWDVLAEAQPWAVEAIVAVLAGLLYRLLGGVFARDTLHSALRTGAFNFIHMLEDQQITRDELIALAIDYARAGSSGAIKRLSAPDDVLRDMAGAKINEILSDKGFLEIPAAGFSRV